MTNTPISNSSVIGLNDADGYLWDITVSGSEIINGTSDAFDGGFQWRDYRSIKGTHYLTDGREVNLGETQLWGAPSGLLGSRSIYVSDTLGYARFLDTITNTRSAVVTYSYVLHTDLGSDSWTHIVDTSDGDLRLETSDTYLSTDDISLLVRDPTVTHVVHGGGFLEPVSTSLATDQYYTTFNLTIQPGQSVSMLSFGFQNKTPADAASQVADFQNNLQNYLEGLNIQERSQVVNFQLASRIATSGDDFLAGLASDDTISGLAGNDQIFGGKGDDLIDGSGGNDTLVGGAGNDTIVGGTGMDLASDDLGEDVYNLGGGNDTLQLSEATFGNDVADGGLGFDLLDFSSFSQRLAIDLESGEVSNFSPISLYAISFEAVVHSNGGGRIDGTSKANSIIARGGDDIVFADAGDDTITGDDGNDRLFGEDGADLISAGAGDDVANGGTGHDAITGDSGNDRLVGGDGNDTLDGGTGNDRLVGQAGDDLLLGGDGDDRLIGGDGADRYEGGAGDDILVDDGPSTQSDTFVFSVGGGNDMVSGYDQGFNVLELDTDLWGGGLSAQQVINRYAFESESATRILIDFGSDSVLLVNGSGLDISTLANDLVLV